MAAEAAAKARPAGDVAPRELIATLRAQMLRRITWGLADQGMSSITNAAVSIYVYRGAADSPVRALSPWLW